MALKFEDIRQAFIDEVDNDKKCIEYYKKIRAGNASYATASLLSIRIAECLGKVLKRHAPETSVYDWDLDDLLPKSLGLDHRMVTAACELIQEQMNKDAGLGIKPKLPEFDYDRVYGLIKELEDHADNFADIEKAFYDQLVNFSQSITDYAIRDNMQLMAKAGIKTQVIRQSEFRACPWCRNLAGTYDYAKVKDTGNEVWRRHENCRCVIDFVTERNSSFYAERVNNYKT